SNVIVDGRHRWKAAKELSIPKVPVIDANLEASEDVVLFIMHAAAKRRNLTEDQRAALAEDLREYLAEKGKETRKAKLIPGAVHRGKSGQSFVEAPYTSTKARARTSAALQHGVSEHRLRKFQRVKKADLRIAAKVKSGELTIKQAWHKIRLRQLQAAKNK